MRIKLLLALWLVSAGGLFGQATDTVPKNIYGGLKMRNLAPAFVSGRIADFAVNPRNPKEYFVAAAAGHIWKTTNNGTTFRPVFDKHGVYSIGCLKMDPNDPNVIWAGTGENNHQRAIGYGNGVYKSVDGGKTWKCMGLKESRQIGMIAIDPTDSDIVYVAAEGSIWAPGGDRGLYKTTDGGKTWHRILYISENTGVNNVVLDPENPQIIYATSEQRRRHVHIRIGGGPESAIYKSTDGGKHFYKIMKGMPKVDIGGIGIAVSPVNPNVVYAIVEAALDKGGFYRSENKGESWKKMSDHFASGQYYNEIYCDPKDVNKVFSVETVSKYTTDGGKTWHTLGRHKRHVDDHALWIDPHDTDHFLIGGDGGVYETYDFGRHYIHKTNLPVTQFYRVNVDNSYPFFWVYGGTQDNSSLGAPSGTLYSDGIARGDWVITLGGDGFWQAVDPTNPDIVYSEYQYGNLFRIDKKSGEKLFIKPQERPGEKMYRWNWNTPFILSPHSPTRLYIGAEKLFRSDDRGQSWQVISGDLTAQLSRDRDTVMGHFWSVEAVAKNVSTSLYGMAVSLDESPLQENLIYVGTDDGLIQVTEDAKTWRKIDHFPGVPPHTYVSDIKCSLHDPHTVFAAFDNRKRDDFNPYLLVSHDKGRSWTSIAGDLPANGTVHSIEQDHKNPDLLFAGTEFGLFFTTNGGKNWVKLDAGMPDVAVRDIAIQRRDDALAMATFGRGFYILDNYAPLRDITPRFPAQKAYLFAVKDALRYVQRNRGGYGFGSMEYKSKNPPFGATFTYYIKDVPKTKAERRREREKKLFKEKKRIPIPTPRELALEKLEVPPYLVFSITDDQGREVRRLRTKYGKGIQRFTWNLRVPYQSPVRAPGGKLQPVRHHEDFYMVQPGTYHVTLIGVVDGRPDTLAGPRAFKVVPYENAILRAPSLAQVVTFQDSINQLGKTVTATNTFIRDLVKEVEDIRQAAIEWPGVPLSLLARADSLHRRLDDLAWKMHGEKTRASKEEAIPDIPPINRRFDTLRWAHENSTAPITATERMLMRIIRADIKPVIRALKTMHEKEIPALRSELDKLGVPWTPGRLPTVPKD